MDKIFDFSLQVDHIWGSWLQKTGFKRLQPPGLDYVRFDFELNTLILNVLTTPLYPITYTFFICALLYIGLC